jgi:hypothetical protein
LTPTSGLTDPAAMLAGFKNSGDRMTPQGKYNTYETGFYRQREHTLGQTEKIFKVTLLKRHYLEEELLMINCCLL